jgi:hypothetical protein
MRKVPLFGPPIRSTYEIALENIDLYLSLNRFENAPEPYQKYYRDGLAPLCIIQTQDGRLAIKTLPCDSSDSFLQSYWTVSVHGQLAGVLGSGVDSGWASP